MIFWIVNVKTVFLWIQFRDPWRCIGYLLAFPHTVTKHGQCRDHPTAYPRSARTTWPVSWCLWSSWWLCLLVGRRLPSPGHHLSFAVAGTFCAFAFSFSAWSSSCDPWWLEYVHAHRSPNTQGTHCGHWRTNGTRMERTAASIKRSSRKFCFSLVVAVRSIHSKIELLFGDSRISIFRSGTVTLSQLVPGMSGGDLKLHFGPFGLNFTIFSS